MVGSEGDGALMASTSGGSGELLDAKTLLLLSNDDSGGALVHAVDLTSGKNKLWTMIAGPGTVLTGKIAVDRTIPLVYVVADGTVRAFDPAAPSMPSSQFSVGGLPSTGMIFSTERSEPCSYYVGTSEGEVRLVNFENFKEGSTACNFLTSESEGHEDRIKVAPEKGAQIDIGGEDQPTRKELLAELDRVLSQPKPMPEEEIVSADDAIDAEVTADGGYKEGEPEMIPGADFSPALGGDDDADSVERDLMGDTPPGESREEPTIPEEVPCEDLEEQDEGPGEVVIEGGEKETKGMEDGDWVSDEEFDRQQREIELNRGPN